MFLFEGSFGNILHTGDCRLTQDYLQSLPEKYVGRRLGEAPKCCLDYIFLDCTFGKSSHRFPSKHSAIRQVILLNRSTFRLCNRFCVKFLHFHCNFLFNESDHQLHMEPPRCTSCLSCL